MALRHHGCRGRPGPCGAAQLALAVPCVISCEGRALPGRPSLCPPREPRARRRRARTREIALRRRRGRRAEAARSYENTFQGSGAKAQRLRLLCFRRGARGLPWTVDLKRLPAAMPGHSAFRTYEYPAPHPGDTRQTRMCFKRARALPWGLAPSRSRAPLPRRWPRVCSAPRAAAPPPPPPARLAPSGRYERQ